ncbi:hypothetical protein ACB092_06G196700 [Castanea dentata]
MAMPKCFWFFFWFCTIVAMLQQPKELEARPLTLQKGRLNNFVATLGIECKCCDGIKGECRSTWDSSCPKLQCLPWKHQ